MRLNYIHLHHFWAVAKEGHLTRAAQRLHLSQSALSTQIRQLEEQLGLPLFERDGRRLVLTEAGRMALTYAETIFATGQEMVSVLRGERARDRQVLRVGSVSTLSRNFQENFLRPLFTRTDVELVIQSAGLEDLLTRLSVHSLDIVLSNRRVQSDAQRPWRSRRIARQPVSLVGPPRRTRKPFRFPEDLTGMPLVLPSRESDIRAGFDLLCEQLDVRVDPFAEVDDMAMLRLLARDSGAIALVPTVVVQDELRNKRLVQYCELPHLFENFYAITTQRRFEPLLVKQLLDRTEEEVLANVDTGSA
jgi:LysR family transcriptional regulator, transcriptional activator of nhaA